MTIHVSLPEQLENMVHNQVDTGMYHSASEVVREALRRFFSGQDQLNATEIAYIRETIAPRMEAVRNGSAELIDGEQYFADRLARLSEE